MEQEGIVEAITRTVCQLTIKPTKARVKTVIKHEMATRDPKKLQQGFQRKDIDLTWYKEYYVGQIIAVLPCFVLDPLVVCMFHDELKQTEKFRKMTEELASGMENLPRLETVPIAGTLVCARYSADKKWYRGAVLQSNLPVSTLAHIYFVDYGNSEDVAIENLRPLTDSLSKYPRGCIVGVMNGVKPREPNFSEQAINAAINLVLHQPMLFRINELKGYDDGEMVGDLLFEDPVTGVRTPLTDKYFEMGIAEPIAFE